MFDDDRNTFTFCVTMSPANGVVGSLRICDELQYVQASGGHHLTSMVLQARYSLLQATLSVTLGQCTHHVSTFPVCWYDTAIFAFL